MAIDARLSKREYDKFRESTATAGQAAIKVVNPDGSNVAGGTSDTELPAAAALADAAANPTTPTIGAALLSFNGSTWDRVRSALTGWLNVLIAPTRRADAIQATITSANATSATQVVAKVAAKNIYVTDIVISTDTAMNIQLQDDNGSPAVLLEQLYVPANSVWSKTFSTPLLVATNQDLDVVASASGNISVTVTGYQV